MENKTIKTTTLCKALLTNAEFTTKDHFIGKSNGEKLFAEWKKSLEDLKHCAFVYYVALAEDKAEEELKALEKTTYTSLKNLLALVGDIPTKEDNTIATKINSSVLFFDAVRFSIKDEAKIEVKKLTTARETLRQAKANYRDNCLTSEGIVKNGLKEEYINTFVSAITEAQTEVDKLLKIRGNSVFGTAEVSFSAFAKKFEIALRKQMLKQYKFTAKEAKAQKAKQKATRKANRTKTTKKD